MMQSIQESPEASIGCTQVGFSCRTVVGDLGGTARAVQRKSIASPYPRQTELSLRFAATGMSPAGRREPDRFSSDAQRLVNRTREEHRCRDRQRNHHAALEGASRHLPRLSKLVDSSDRRRRLGYRLLPRRAGAANGVFGPARNLLLLLAGALFTNIFEHLWRARRRLSAASSPK